MGSGSDVRPMGEDLKARYDRVRHQLVPKFLHRHRLTVSGLAQLIDVARSSLSRFLNGVTGYEPVKGRTGKLELLEQLESYCSQVNIRLELDEVLLRRRESEGEAESEFEVMFRHYTERIMTLGERYEPALALSLLPEFFAYALGALPPYGASMCSNLLGVVTGLVDRPGIEDASDDLLRTTLRRVRELEARALEVATEEFRRTASQHPVGYAGYSLAMIGMRLDDDSVLEAGLERMERAAFVLSDAEDESQWPNFMTVLEELLERGHPRANEWSESVASRASTSLPAGLIATHRARAFSRLRAHWSACSPGLMRQIDDAESDETEPPG